MRWTVFGSSRRARVGSVVAAALVVTAVAVTAMFVRGAVRIVGEAAVHSPSDYKTLPVYFEQNRGQTDPRVQFLSRGPGYTVFLTGHSTVLALRKIAAPTSSGSKDAQRNARDVKVTTASVWINLLGARSGAQVEGIDPLPGRVNYFIGNDSTKWHTDIPTYARVNYRSVYPGIDLIYYGTSQALEYDLIAAPGADPGAIRIELQGADQTRVDAAGNLVISTAAGDLTMRKPRVYQDTTYGTRSTVDARYRVTAAGSKRTVELALAEHDPRLPLVIDPELVYSSYLGGNGDRSGPIQGFASLPPQLLAKLMFSDAAITLALGPGNAVYTTGLAYSSNFPATPGAFQSTNQASPNTTPNGFVAKFDTTKTGADSLVYSTYLGGSGCSTAPCTKGHDGDQGTGIAVDTSGDAYVSGLTYSKNFPNPNCGSFGTGNNAAAVDINNGFVAELAPTGSRLVYSCFIHGSDGAPASAVAIKPGCASNCAAYVTGNTTSEATIGGKPDFPIHNAFQLTNPDTNGNSAGYVTVVNGGGGSLMYSSFLGGTGTPTGGESLTRIAVDGTGRAYVTGASFSSDYPKKNAFQSSNNGFTLGVQNAVVSGINPSLSGAASLFYSTYLGGSGLSLPFGLGNFGDIAAGIALDSGNHIYVAGVATSSDFPHNGTKPAYQPTNNAGGVGGANGFVSELDPSQTPAKQLVYSTYIGGPADLLGSPLRPGDAATDVAVDSVTGKIYLTGAATSTKFPVINTCTQMSTIGASDQADAFVSVLDPNVTPATAQLQFSTYLGGTNIDVAAAIARDSTNMLYVAGVTFSGDFPVTKNAFQFGNNAFAAGHTNAFITKLDTSSTVCPTPFPSPSITATPTPTATKPVATPTPTHKATPTATATPAPGQPTISSVSPIIEVGSSFEITGTGFTKGSVVNFFVATSTGSVKEGVLHFKSQTPTMLIVPVPDTIPLGQGFASVVVINTDTGFQMSNPGYALLQGDPAAGIPTIDEINGKGLADTSKEPNFATNNVETVVMQGSVVKLGGDGFDIAKGVGVDLFCACPPPGKVQFFLNPGNPGLTKTQLSFPLPAKGLPNSPLTGPGSFVVTNQGSGKKSNAVSVPIGAQIKVTSVTQPLSTSPITVGGAGFSTLTVINFFNTQSGKSVNLGGLKPDGSPKIPLVFINENKFTFTKPAGAEPGPSYVEAFNPPFVPFTSSGTGPLGKIDLK